MLLMFAKAYCSIGIAFRPQPAGDAFEHVMSWLDRAGEVHQRVPGGEKP